MNNKEKKQSEIKKEEQIIVPTQEVKQEEPKLRQIILETDGNSVQLVKAEVTSMIELQAILSLMLEALRK